MATNCPGARKTRAEVLHDIISHHLNASAILLAALLIASVEPNLLLMIAGSLLMLVFGFYVFVATVWKYLNQCKSIIWKLAYIPLISYIALVTATAYFIILNTRLSVHENPSSLADAVSKIALPYTMLYTIPPLILYRCAGSRERTTD